MFNQQYANARDHIIPWLADVLPSPARVLDIGCGEGGVLKAFHERGDDCLGVELSASRVRFARERLSAERETGRMDFAAGDIHDARVHADWGDRFDLVILKDAIEHIPDKRLLLERLAHFVNETGIVFVGFPPWRMPFGGHQQITSSTLAKIPYSHLLPQRLYDVTMRAFGESERTIEELAEIRDTRLSINGFESLAIKAGFKIARRDLFLINPIYQFKFGLTPRKQLPIVRSLPWIRDFVTTTCYYALKT